VNKIVSFTVVLLLVATAQLGTPSARAGEAEAKALEEYVQMIAGDLPARRDSAMSALLQLEGDEAKAFGLVDEVIYSRPVPEAA
jgi:hypothetical protein